MLFSLYGRRKRGKKQVERNSHELPLLAFPLPYISAPATQVGLRYSACEKVVVFFSDFFQASESKREANEDSSPSGVFALHACFAF